MRHARRRRSCRCFQLRLLSKRQRGRQRMDPNSLEFQKAVMELRARAVTESFDLDARLRKYMGHAR
jgi:hypothetical protein